MNKESMVFYESAYKAINYLPDETMQLEAYKGLMEYGFYGVIPQSNNPFVNMIFVQSIPSMRSARDRYEKAVENGKKGGRPTDVSTESIVQMKQDGLTNREIADQTGVTTDAIKKRLQRNKGTKGTNLSVSVSDSVSVSETDSVSLTETNSESVSSTVSSPTAFPYKEKESCKEVAVLVQDYENDDLPF